MDVGIGGIFDIYDGNVMFSSQKGLASKSFLKLTNISLLMQNSAGASEYPKGRCIMIKTIALPERQCLID